MRRLSEQVTQDCQGIIYTYTYVGWKVGGVFKDYATVAHFKILIFEISIFWSHFKINFMKIIKLIRKFPANGAVISDTNVSGHGKQFV
jgi:hypothetical protein